MGMTFNQMKALSMRDGGYYFTDDTINFWASKIEHLANNNGIFVESVRNFDDTARVYMVKAITGSGSIETLEPHDVARTSGFFPDLKSAESLAELISKELKEQIGNELPIYVDSTHFKSGEYVFTTESGKEVTVDTNKMNYEKSDALIAQIKDYEKRHGKIKEDIEK